MQTDFPDSVQVDSFVASLVGRTSLAVDAVLWNPMDKKVDSSLKKVFSGTHLDLCAGIYGTYVAESLISDIKTLHRALDESSDCSGFQDLIMHQVEFLSDVPFDVVLASALAEGACVVARRNLVLID
ncbi:hypothetical protein NDU88_001055 [Pleurodeles waltl]|uniref:Uncharacterized protein n=1 Tax=Pleurodeles waltl TaxID=8319 RepID=A0AAV7NCD5_PLEWA|nr:hypothetical protein NDU88_001055 [Pleurodeles waltl]